MTCLLASMAAFSLGLLVPVTLIPFPPFMRCIKRRMRRLNFVLYDIEDCYLNAI